MKLSEAYPSKYLKAADLGGQTKTVTIASIEEAEVGKKREKKFCISFAGMRQQLVLNKTNKNTLEQIFGDPDFEDLPGKQVTLVLREVDYNGETHSAIRIVAAKPIVEQEVVAKQREDNIPF